MRGTSILAVAVICMAGSPLSSQAQPYPDVVRASSHVLVRDGTKLAVNIYRPARNRVAEARPLPVIFAFTPYRARFRSKDGTIVELGLDDRLALRSLIGAGYIVATADIRGKGASFGHRRGFQDRTEALDGYDLVEWLARQPFSTGKVGMIGCSYLGGTTFHTATTAPPSLKAAFIGASDLDKYAFVRRGGIPAQFNTRPDEPAEMDLASIPVDADVDGSLLKAAVAEHAANTPMAALWYGMPFRDSISSFTGNAFWEEVGVYNHLDAIRRAGTALYFWGNWQDEPTAQSLLSAANFPQARFLAGPGSHCVPPPGFDFTGEITRFFDRHLKGVGQGAAPRATYWIEGLDGSGGYVTADTLPGEDSQARSWFLGTGKSGTARSVNDGRLVVRAGKSGADQFAVRYDLPDPEYFAFWAKPMDDKGLSYTTAPLATAAKLVGFPIARLSVSADRSDAQVFVYLDQVDARGKAEVVAFGRLSLSHHREAQAPYAALGLPFHRGRKADVVVVKPGQIVRLNIDMTPIARLVPVGARLRLTIAGADPRQRNLKDIRQVPAPVITVHRGGANASMLTLPVAH